MFLTLHTLHPIRRVSPTGLRTAPRRLAPLRAHTMANRTDPDAPPAHGQDPQLLVPHITRTRVYETLYWNTFCFGASAAGVVHLAARLRYIGGTFGPTQTPSAFLCLLQKLLQLGPEEAIVDAYVSQTEFKYARLLGAFYTRVVGRGRRVYEAIEPLLGDWRKVVVRDAAGAFAVVRVDELVERFLRQGEVFGVKLPRLPERGLLEETERLPKRVSALPKEDIAMLDEADD